MELCFLVGMLFHNDDIVKAYQFFVNFYNFSSIVYDSMTFLNTTPYKMVLVGFKVTLCYSSVTSVIRICLKWNNPPWLTAEKIWWNEVKIFQRHLI